MKYGYPVALAIFMVCALPVQAAVQRSFLNNGFESSWGGSVTAATWCFASQSTVSPWLSTDSTGSPFSPCLLGSFPIIELWFNGFLGVPPRSGKVLAELNANSPGTLSQNVCLLPSETVTWRLSHRGRSGTDNMQFFVGSNPTSGLVLDASTSPTGGTTINACQTGTSIGGPNTCTKATTGTWGDYSGLFTWTGSAGIQSINFRAIGGGSVGNLLDEVYLSINPIVEFSASNASGIESVATPVTAQLKVVGTLTSPLVVSVTITGGTAILGTDFTTPNGTATFNVAIPVGGYDGSASFPTGINVLNDKLHESDKTIIFQVNAASNYVIGSSVSCGAAPNNQTTYTITDDDASLRLIKNTVGGTGNFNFALTNVDTNVATSTVNETAASIATMTDGVPVEFDANTTSTGIQSIGVEANGIAVTISETPSTSWAVSGSCSVTGGTNPTSSPIDISTAGAVTIPAANMTSGSTATCTYTNTKNIEITGTVFEDINYGGGSGRSITASSGTGLANVRVELYDSTGVYVTSTLTDASGKYTFNGGISGNLYYVRAVNNTIPSSRNGYVAGLLPIQTYRTDDSTGTVTPVTDHVGGEDPTKTDAGNGSTGDRISTAAATLGLYTGGTLNGGQAQSVAPVKVGSPVTGIDFGYNFDTIVNNKDSGQGSLRQFILNSNALSNTGLAQVGQTAGKEVSIFMVSDGSAHPGHRSGLSNQLTGGVAIITASTGLPAITDSNTTIDGTAQTTLVGDSNSAVLGAGGRVGVDSLGLSTVNGPEVQLIPGVSDTLLYGLDLQGNSPTVRGLAVYGFGKNLASNPTVFSGDIHVTGPNAVIEQNILGTAAQSFIAPVSGWTYGSGIVAENSTNGIIRNNLIGFHDGTGIVLRKSTGFTVSNNEVRGNDLHDYGTMDGISTVSSGGGHDITGNLVANNGACGIDNGRQDDLVIRNNTVNGNGISRGVGQSSYQFVETPGIRLGGSRARIERNIIEANYGAGILVRAAAAGNENVNPTQNTFTQNSIFQNGAISNRGGRTPSRQIGIDIEVPGQNSNQGTSPFITPNNGVNLGAPNDGMDYPVITSATLRGQVLMVSGYIGNSGPVSSFGGSTIEFFIGDVADSAQQYGQVVASRPDTGSHWEGKTYLGSCLAYSSGYFSCGLNRPVVGSVFDVANLSLTATSANGSTSEFGDRLPSMPQDSVSGTVFLDTGKGGVAGVPNNGISDGGETGIANAQVTLHDCGSNAILGQSVTDGSGAYTITVPANTADGTLFCLKERNAAQQITYISTGASQTSTALSSTSSATSITYDRSTDMMKFAYVQGNSYSTLNFGDVPANQFITDGAKSGSPGNTLWYTHSFTAGTGGSVRFSLPGAIASHSIPGWNEVLYTDTNCNGSLDSGENQTVTAAINVFQGEQICLLVKEHVPAAEVFGATNLVVVKSDFVYTNAAPAITTSYTRQDLTTVSDAVLDLKKRVRNATVDGTGAPNWQVNNTAKSGEMLEYQITYTNNGATAINTLTVRDATPAYTTFVSALAGSLPDNLGGCIKTTPTSSAPALCSAADGSGGTGGIEWKFSGSLEPGASGVVTFKVKLD